MSRYLLTAVVLLAALNAAGPARAAPISSHAMVYSASMPLPLKERIFAEAKASGAEFIRVDVQLKGIFEGAGSRGRPDWRGVDEVTELARRYDLRVLGIILDSPTWLSTCPDRGWPDATRCAVRDPAEFGRLAAEVAAHARPRIDHWEILNEPDARWAFKGRPEDYARMLSAAYDAIKARVPEAQVVSGGVERPDRLRWIQRVFATPGVHAAQKFDISGVHLRVRAHDMVADLAPRLARWRRMLAGYGFTGPVWVTEHGYPADSNYQWDPAYRTGDAGQVAYLRESIPLLAEAGAAQVFVTLRDNDWGEYLSEGLNHIDVTQPSYPVGRRPAFEAVRELARNWSAVMATREERRREEQMATLLGRLSAESKRAGHTLAAALQEGAAQGHLLVAERLAQELAASAPGA